jgi:hypothetical protein
MMCLPTCNLVARMLVTSWRHVSIRSPSLLGMCVGIRRRSTWPRGYTPCWQVYTDKTRVMPFIPTKSVACMSTSWLLDNVYTAKSCKDTKPDPDALKLGLVGYERLPWQKTLALQDSRGLDVGLTTPPWKRLVTKSEEAIAGYFSW